MINLTNGLVQNCANGTVPNGSISFQLNVDATVLASPYGFVAANPPVIFQFDASGNILPLSGMATAQIWSNAELNPQNDIGLGTYYLVTFYDANGAQINKLPLWFQFTEAAGATVDLGQMVPFSTVGGNVIFYPTSFFIGPPGPSTLGGVFSNVGVTHQWVSAINTNGSITLTQPSFADISGTISSAQLPSPITFGATTFSGLITAQANIQLGVSGTTTGAITFEGGTSGTATITAPAVAGTVGNPITFSNSLNIPTAGVFAINADTGISRDSAGVIDVGNGTAGNKSGSINLTNLTATGTITGPIASAAISASATVNTATQPTFRLTDSELTVGSTVTSISGSVAGVRGNITLSSGGTITGSSFIYGVQGKITAEGTLNNGSAFNAGVFAQLDTSNAGFAHTSGYFAPFIGDFGATSHLTSDPLADGIIILNTTTSLVNSILKTEAKAQYLFDLNDLGQGQYIVSAAVAGSQNACLQIKVNGTAYYIPLNTAHA